MLFRNYHGFFQLFISRRPHKIYTRISSSFFSNSRVPSIFETNKFDILKYKQRVKLNLKKKRKKRIIIIILGFDNEYIRKGTNIKTFYEHTEDITHAKGISCYYGYRLKSTIAIGKRSARKIFNLKPLIRPPFYRSRMKERI